MNESESVEKVEEEEYFQVPRTSTNINNFILTESDQLDGIVENTTAMLSPAGKLCLLNMNQRNEEINVIRVDLSKDDDLNGDNLIDDDDEHELLPSNARFKVSLNENTKILPNKQEETQDKGNEEELLAKAGIKRNNLLVPRIKITDLNNLIPDLACQKVKIVNDKGLNLSSDASKTITVLNKDSSRYKLAILPNSNESNHNNNSFVNFKYNSPQIKVYNNNNPKITTTTTIAKPAVPTNIIQDYEFGDSLKFVTNIKPTLLNSLDSETPSQSIVSKKPTEERTKSDKLISTIFENLAKSYADDPKVPVNKVITMSNQAAPLYKLGMESNYRMYENQYTVNPITMNKHQHNQERDRKNILSRRFSITQDFHWKGNLFSNLDILAKTISNTIIQIENSLSVPFMHHLWPQYRDKWLRKLHNSKNVIDFAKCLLELEASMKPVLFVSAWKDGTGYLKLHRETFQEREEHKKEESLQFKRRTLLNTTAINLDETAYGQSQHIRMAHFTKGIKHQVFKQKGEEYRLTGTGGWYWFHKTRRSHSKNNSNCIKKSNSADTKLNFKNLLLNNLKDKKCIENILVEEDNIPDADQPWYNNSLHPYLQVFNIETIDISENLVTRTYYPKEMKFKSKYLDFLLEKRLKSYEELKIMNQQLMKKLEEKLIDIEIEEIKKQDAGQKMETDSAVAALKDLDVDAEHNCEIKTKEENLEISRDAVREKLNLNKKVNQMLEMSKISLSGEYLVELDNELIKIPIVENNTSYKFKLKNLKKSKNSSIDAKLPPYSEFMINNKTTIFLFPNEVTRLIARKGGFKVEIPGFKNEHHKQSVYWPYPCNRPLLKTCWCYKTFTAPNFASLALQVRYFFSCIRWDAINERPPMNSSSYHGGIEPILTAHFEDYVQTTEIIKKRNVGLYNLRSEYLIRKKKTPYHKKSKQS